MFYRGNKTWVRVGVRMIKLHAPKQSIRKLFSYHRTIWQICFNLSSLIFTCHNFE